jgi:hypothetical protein
MSPQGRLPSPEAVQTLLAVLLDRDVHVARGSSASRWEAIAGFAADDGVIVAACLCDLNLAATLGAALALMPCGAAQAAIEAGGLPEALSDNFREVANVTAGLLSRVGPHVKLGDVVFAPSTPGEDLASVIGAPLDHLDLDVSVAGYEPGKMALVVR